MGNKYIINIGNFTVGEVTYENRCLSAAYGGTGVESEVIPWENTDYNPWDYKYESGKFILEVIDIPEPNPEISQTERNAANIDYLSMMTGIDLPEEV